MAELSETEKLLTKIKESRDYADPENRKYVDGLEKKFERLKSDKAFLELDYIKDIKKRVKSIILSNKKQLVDQDDPDKRLRLKADRDAYIWLLHFFTKDIQKEMDEINNKAEEML